MDRSDAQAQKMKNQDEPDIFQKYNLVRQPYFCADKNRATKLEIMP